MPRRIRDYGVAAVALTALVVALTRIDDRVPGHLSGMANDVWHGRLTAPAPEVTDFLVRMSGGSTLDNVFLVALVGAAGLLLVLMVRT